MRAELRQKILTVCDRKIAQSLIQNFSSEFIVLRASA